MMNFIFDNPQLSNLSSVEKMKYKLSFFIFLLSLITCFITFNIHLHQTFSNITDLVGSSSLFLVTLLIMIQLYRKPQNTEKFICGFLIIAQLNFVIVTLFHIIRVSNLEDLNLVGVLPPFTVMSVLWITTCAVFFPVNRVFFVTTCGSAAFCLPLVIYFLFHPSEIQTARGLDLFVSLSFGVLGQMGITKFYTSLQIQINRLNEERIEYYSKVIEEQEIRHQAMEEAFSQFHNGPLQNLAILIRGIEQKKINSEEVIDKLNSLNQEIRGVGEYLTSNNAISLTQSVEGTWLNDWQSNLRLGSGQNVNLNLPLQKLLYMVFSETIDRDLPHFQNIKIKVRSFDSVDNEFLTVEKKQNICLWLEEVLCNVGKHAVNSTRIKVIGVYQDDRYTLTVQDNGVGLNSSVLSGRGIKQNQLLAEKLQGTFTIQNTTKGGVKCELITPIVM